MLFHNLYVPVVREDERKVKRLLQPASYSDAKGNGLTLSESGMTIWKRRYHRRCFFRVLPHQGFKMHVQGLRIRPQPPNQAQVVVELQKLSGNSDNPLQATPFVQSNLDVRSFR